MSEKKRKMKMMMKEEEEDITNIFSDVNKIFTLVYELLKNFWYKVRKIPFANNA